jgi:1-phosphatidylinositol-3-phosphate 5-kinase
MEYQKEIGQMAGVRQGPMPSLPSTPPPVSRKSLFSGRLFSSSSLSMDPDQEGHVWHEPETFSAAVTREEHPRDASGILSIREVLRQKAPENVGLASRFTGFGSRTVSNSAAPPSAWAKPAVEVSKQEATAGLLVNGLPDCGGSGGAEKILQDMEAASNDIPLLPSRPGSVFGSYTPSTYEAHIRRWKTSSIISSDNSLISQDASIEEHFTSVSAPPPPPPKDGQEGDDSKQAVAEKPLPATNPVSTPATSGFTASITNSLTNAMRLMLTGGEASRPTSPVPRNHHGLLTVESMGWDDKPHIKHDWTVGKRLKFSCVVYYAKQFDGLRRRCGLEENFLQSLGRSLNWAAQGGKSRSNFWKTADDRYIIKTLVDAWNVADLWVILFNLLPLLRSP